MRLSAGPESQVSSRPTRQYPSTALWANLHPTVGLRERSRRSRICSGPSSQPCKNAWGLASRLIILSFDGLSSTPPASSTDSMSTPMARPLTKLNMERGAPTRSWNLASRSFTVSPNDFDPSWRSDGASGRTWELSAAATSTTSALRTAMW